jgi:hypothetical protein
MNCAAAHLGQFANKKLDTSFGRFSPPMCPIFCVYKILKNQLITLCATSIISGYFVASNGRAVLDLSINVWYNQTNTKELDEEKTSQSPSKGKRRGT